jgi:sortase A
MSRIHGMLSWFVALALIVGAGAVAWYFTARQGASVPVPASETLTMEAPAAEAPSTGDPEAAAEFPSRRLAGGLPTRLVIGSAGIETAIDEVGIFESEEGELEWETSQKAAGHNMDSARPGQPGNMILGGHVSVADPDDVAVFENLLAVREGDLVQVYSGDQMFTYRVDEIRTVPPDDISVLEGDYRARLTMITCTVDLQDRLVVVATLVS